MATLMEKDVLMELVNGGIALLSKQEPSAKLNEDNQNLYNFYSALIRNPPEIFDFHAMVNKIKEIKRNYE